MDSNTELVDEDVLVISVIPIKKEAILDSTISVDLCYIGEDVEDSVNAPRDKLDETIAKKAAVNLLRESDNILLL